MPGPSDPNPNRSYAMNASPNDDLETLFNRVRNVEGSDAADRMLRAIYKPSGYQQSDPINGIQRDVQGPKPDMGPAILNIIHELATRIANPVSPTTTAPTLGPANSLGNQF